MVVVAHPDLPARARPALRPVAAGRPVGQPRALGQTPPGWAVAVAAALTIVPPTLIIQYFLDLKLAVVGAVCFGIAILMLARWPRPKTAEAPGDSAPAASAASSA